ETGKGIENMDKDNRLFLITDKDNVAVALKDVRQGEEVRVGEHLVKALKDIPTGHKIAVTEIKEGEDIMKYGFSIGKAKTAIPSGEHVHTHNVKTGLHDLMTYTYSPKNESYTV